ICGHAAIAVDSAARLSELNHSRFIIAAVSQTRRSGFLWIATSGRGHYGRRRLTRHPPQYLRTPVTADNRRNPPAFQCKPASSDSTAERSVGEEWVRKV